MHLDDTGVALSSSYPDVWFVVSQGPGGDASFDELFEDDFEFLNLPKCANDDAHDVVRLHVGLGAEYNGPYDYYLPGLIGGGRRQSGDEDNSFESESEEDEEEDWDPYA